MANEPGLVDQQAVDAEQRGAEGEAEIAEHVERDLPLALAGPAHAAYPSGSAQAMPPPLRDEGPLPERTRLGRRRRRVTGSERGRRHPGRLHVERPPRPAGARPSRRRRRRRARGSCGRSPSRASRCSKLPSSPSRTIGTGASRVPAASRTFAIPGRPLTISDRNASAPERSARASRSRIGSGFDLAGLVQDCVASSPPSASDTRARDVLGRDTRERGLLLVGDEDEPLGWSASTRRVDVGRRSGSARKRVGHDAARLRAGSSYGTSGSPHDLGHDGRDHRRPGRHLDELDPRARVAPRSPRARAAAAARSRATASPRSSLPTRLTRISATFAPLRR